MSENDFQNHQTLISKMGLKKLLYTKYDKLVKLTKYSIFEFPKLINGDEWILCMESAA